MTARRPKSTKSTAPRGPWSGLRAAVKRGEIPPPAKPPPPARHPLSWARPRPEVRAELTRREDERTAWAEWRRKLRARQPAARINTRAAERAGLSARASQRLHGEMLRSYISAVDRHEYDEMLLDGVVDEWARVWANGGAIPTWTGSSGKSRFYVTEANGPPRKWAGKVFASDYVAVEAVRLLPGRSVAAAQDDETARARSGASRGRKRAYRVRSKVNRGSDD